VAGAIVDAITMDPMAGRRGGFGAMAGAGTTQPAEVRTGPDGSFRLDGLAPGRARISAHRDGSNLGDSQSADVPEGGVASADLTLRDEGVLTGRVGTKSGGPLKTSVTVRAMPTGGQMMILGPSGMASVDVDPTGVYRLVLPAATYNVIAQPASQPGFAMPRSRNMATIEVGQTTNKDISLDDDSDAAVTGVVLEPEGGPSAGAMVRVMGTTPGQRMMMAMPADDQGHFNVTGSRAQLGALTITATNGGRTGTVSIGPDQTQATVQLQASASLKGHVTGAAPVQGFRVTVASASPGGRMAAQDLEFAGDTFQVDDVPADQLIVSVKTRDGRLGTARTTVASGQTGQVDVPLQDATTVLGRVVGPDGAPVNNAMVSITDGDPMSGVSSQTTPDGRFKLTNVAPGDHTLRIYMAPATFKRQTITAPAGQPLDLGDIKLDLPRADPGTIGVNLRTDGDGVAVASLIPGGPADTAGVRLGDLVTAIDGVAVRSVADATARVVGAPGSPCNLGLSRSGNALALSVTRAQ
jgi:hypothetical protein